MARSLRVTVPKLRFAIMSDIHADEQENSDTRIYLEPAHAHRGQYPMADLHHLIQELSLTADYLLLPGDTANKANADGLQYGWRKSHGIASLLGARLIATAGNHDVITHAPSTDRWQMLRDLLPGFPTGDAALDRQYWARGWCVLEQADHRILVLNSTADFPPYPADPLSPEGVEYFGYIERGGLLPTVEDEVRAFLASAQPKINVAMIHHHPLEHQLASHLQDSYGPMRRGGELIELFTNAHSSGRWLVLHGHKHIPQLVRATSVSSNGPIVLCAGSLGAKIWDPVDTVARNQFHVLELEDRAPEHGSTLIGAVESFSWGVGVGWYRAERKGSGLPARAGFGSNADPAHLAARVDALVPDSPGAFLPYCDLVGELEDLPYLMPADEEALEFHLAGRGLRALRGADNQVELVGRKAEPHV
ncbi:3',5'-cyclic adenosine monophosphate phosphodiesterase CpdA [Microbacterium sp. Bi98]|nr:3',5'-cyclic adenosine monophosphate phosphodiesterase CpdA [Microbacterium sp. Bi98]